MGLELVPLTLREANAFVRRHHRHSKPVRGAKFSIGAAKDGEIVGVVLVGRPVARRLDNGWTCEALRCCTDGTRNACSILYAAAWRAARAMGYRKMVTYTHTDESGSSLKAVDGFVCIGEAGGGNWNKPGRPRVDTDHQQKKLRWEISA